MNPELVDSTVQYISSITPLLIFRLLIKTEKQLLKKIMKENIRSWFFLPLAPLFVPKWLAI
jgi:hypothetical protein